MTMTTNTNNSTTMTSRRRRKRRRRKRRIVGGRSRGTDGRVWRARPSVSCDGSLPRGCRPPPTALSSSRHCRSGTDDNRGCSSLSARPRRQNEGGGTPLHHPLRVEHRRGGGNDGIGVVVPASVSASVLVRSSLSARPRRQNEGGGTPLHHPLRVEHRRGGGNDGIGVVVPAFVSASVLVDIDGSTPTCSRPSSAIDAAR
jgi:hypothetical protein